MDEPENIIWSWKPERKMFDESDPHRHDDVAEEYVIERRDTAESGIVLLAKYHGEWVVPWSSRPVIVKLLSEMGTDLPLPKKRV